MGKIDRVIENTSEEQLARELSDLRREFDDFKSVVMVAITKLHNN